MITVAAIILAVPLLGALGLVALDRLLTVHDTHTPTVPEVDHFAAWESEMAQPYDWQVDGL